MRPEANAPSRVASSAHATLVFRMEGEYYIGTFFLLLLFFGLMVVGYLPILYSYLAYGTVFAPLQRAVMYLSATYFLLLLLARFGRAEMDKVRFWLSDTTIGYRSSVSAVEIPLGDVSSVVVRSFPLIKGYVVVSGNGKRIRLPSTMHRFGDMVEALLERFAENGRNDLCDQRQAHALRRIASVAAFSQARSRAAFFPLVYATLLTVPCNAWIAGMVWRAGGVLQVIWMGIGLFAPLAVYGLADFRLNRALERQLLRDPDALPRLSLRTEILFASLVVACLFMAGGILLRTLFVV